MNDQDIDRLNKEEISRNEAKKWEAIGGMVFWICISVIAVCVLKACNHTL